MEMEEGKVSGVVHLVDETRTYGARGFRKRMIVLEKDDGRFSSYIPVELIQDNCDLANDLSVGDQVEVIYRLTGRKWQRDANSETKYFLSAEALEFKVLGKADAASGGDSASGAGASGDGAVASGAAAGPLGPEPPPIDDEDDPIPF